MKVIILNNIDQADAIIDAIEESYGNEHISHSLSPIEIHEGPHKGKWALPWDDGLENIVIRKARGNRSEVRFGDKIGRRNQRNYKGINFNSVTTIPDSDAVDMRDQKDRDADPEIESRKQQRLLDRQRRLSRAPKKVTKKKVARRRGLRP